MKIYLAGPLFTAPELKWNEDLAIELRSLDHQVWLPQEHVNHDMDAGEIFDVDVEGLDWCEVVVACLDQPDPDSGTSWELGYCWKSKFCYYYRSDIRSTREWEGVKINIMLEKSTTEIFPEEYTVYSVARAINKIMKIHEEMM